MNETAEKTYQDFVLPPSVVSKADLSRLVREAEWIDGELTAVVVRAKAGQAATELPPISDQFRDFVTDNKLNFEESRQRTAVIKQLRKLKDKAPVIHITFASVADGESLQYLAKWVRTALHPQAIMAIGIQPALVAGVYIRTPNHVYDMSLRAKLAGSHELLARELEALSGK